MKNKTNPKVATQEKLTRIDLSLLLYEAKNLSAFVKAFAEHSSLAEEGIEFNQDKISGLFEVTHRIYKIVEKVEKCATGHIDLDGEWNHG